MLLSNFRKRRVMNRTPVIQNAGDHFIDYLSIIKVVEVEEFANRIELLCSVTIGNNDLCSLVFNIEI